MFLSDCTALRNVLRNASIVTVDAIRYNEQVDVDIERMFAGSPIINEWSTVCNFDILYQVETEVSLLIAVLVLYYLTIVLCGR